MTTKANQRRNLVLAWMAIEALTWTAALLVGGLRPPDRSVGLPPPVAAMSAFDGQHYGAIATAGYSGQGPARREFNMFPLLPAVARLLGGRSNAALAGIVFSQLCFLTAVLLLERLEEAKAGSKPLRSRPAFWLLVSPVSFFFSMFYTESLFLLLSLVVFLAYRENRFGLCAVAGLLAGLTRPTAVCLPALVVGDLWHRVRQGRSWRTAALCAVAPLCGFTLYIAAVAYATGDAFGYFSIRRGWDAYWTVPFLPWLHNLRLFVFDLAKNGQVGPLDQVVAFASTIGVVAVMAWGWRRLDRALLLYVAVSMILVHSEAPSLSTARFEVVLFPVFLLLPLTMIGRPPLALPAAAAMLGAQMFLLVRHMTWKWVA